MGLNAVRGRIGTGMFRQHEVDDEKVNRLVAHLRAKGEVPPVVVAMYNGKALPLDGHHRLLAFAEVGADWVDAWVVQGGAFDRLCSMHRNAENLVFCDGVPAMEVAERWSTGNGPGSSGHKATFDRDG